MAQVLSGVTAFPPGTPLTFGFVDSGLRSPDYPGYIFAFLAPPNGVLIAPKGQSPTIWGGTPSTSPWGSPPAGSTTFWGTPAVRGEGFFDSPAFTRDRGEITGPNNLEATRAPVALTRVILCHGADSGDWFQVPPNTEIIMFSKNGQTLYGPQVKGIFKWIRDTSAVLPTKNMETLDGKEYSIEDAVGNESIKIKISINSPNLIHNTGPFGPIATNSVQSKALAGLPAGSLCPDLLVMSNRPEEMFEDLNGTPWGEGPITYPSGFVGIYLPDQVQGVDDPNPDRHLPLVASGGLEKQPTQWLRALFKAAPALGSPYMGGRLSQLIGPLRKAYVDYGMLKEGEIFRLFIIACSSDSAPPGIHRTGSVRGVFRGTLGRTNSTRGLRVGGFKKTRRYRRNKHI